MRLLLITVIAIVYALPASSSADLIAAWHFDETGGAVANAAVGSVNGALVGGSSFVVGGITGGAVSTTAGGFVDMGNNFSFHGNSTFSIVAWFRTNSSDGMIVAGRHQATVISGHFLGVNNTSSGSGEVTGGAIFYQAYPNPVSANLNLNDGTWHQLVAVHNFAGNQSQLYVDGTLRDTEGYTAFAQSIANFAVGGVMTSGGTMVNSFNGQLDEVSIWDHALTSSDVQYLFDNPGAVPEPSALSLLSLSILALSARRSRTR